MTKKKVQHNHLTTLAAIGAVTVIVLTALVINSEGKFDLIWGEDGGSLCIKGKQITRKIDDHLSKKESSHDLKCNNQ